MILHGYFHGVRMRTVNYDTYLGKVLVDLDRELTGQLESSTNSPL